MAKTYWMLVTSEENFHISREGGFEIQGFEHHERRKASRVTPKDRILYYLSDRRVFAATATVSSDPFEDDSPIWKHHNPREDFHQRVNIKSDSILDDEQYVDALQVGPGLEYVRKWAPEDWPLAFIGQLHIIPQKDFTFLEAEIKRAASKKPKPQSGRGGGKSSRSRRSSRNRKNSGRNRSRRRSGGGRGPAVAAGHETAASGDAGAAETNG